MQTGIDPAGAGSLQPQLVLEVESPGSLAIYHESGIESRPVISPQLAYLVQHVLADAPVRWPSLKSPNPLELDRPAGVKVGTASGGHSTWTVGYTRQTVSAVWLGTHATSRKLRRWTSIIQPASGMGSWPTTRRDSRRRAGTCPPNWSLERCATHRGFCQPRTVPM